jgi:phosphatidylglycerophosphate synthase
MLGMRPPVQTAPLAGLSDQLTPASRVTAARAALSVAVAALAVDSFSRPVPTAMLVTLATVALVLDGVDGWVARRTGTTTFGARFDAEVDAFLILALSVYVSRTVGAWVLAIGAARYAFLVAGWLLPWMRQSLPPRYWRKVVAATVGTVLTVAAAGFLPTGLVRAALVVSLGLLVAAEGLAE